MSQTADQALMRRAIAAARAVLGKTWPNPAVGCVLAADGLVLAQSATAGGGRPHAEEQALALAGPVARGAIAYVTLEPCGQRSSGVPSCSERLVEAGVARVIIAADNPEPLSAGRGLKRLQDAGVPVEMGFLADEAEPLYRAFRHRLRTGLALVEEAVSDEGFDGAYAPEPGETVEAALRRLAGLGMARLWVAAGSEAAAGLKKSGFLA